MRVFRRVTSGARKYKSASSRARAAAFPFGTTSATTTHSYAPRCGRFALAPGQWMRRWRAVSALCPWRARRAARASADKQPILTNQGSAGNHLRDLLSGSVGQSGPFDAGRDSRHLSAGGRRSYKAPHHTSRRHTSPNHHRQRRQPPGVRRAYGDRSALSRGKFRTLPMLPPQ
jgi:hypothetical protein